MTRRFKSRWEPFNVRLDVGDLDIIIDALRLADSSTAIPSPARRQLRKDLELTRSDLWKHLP